MDLNDFIERPQVDPAAWATWTVLATATGDATEYRVCTADNTVYHVVKCPHGPDEVILPVSDHSDYVTALRAVAAMIDEDELSAGRHAATPLDITPRLRIRRSWYCDKGPYAGMFGVGLEPLYVTPDELNQLHSAAKFNKEDN